jgi:ABC-type multidrug transport system ATPase subunit
MGQLFIFVSSMIYVAMIGITIMWVWLVMNRINSEFRKKDIKLISKREREIKRLSVSSDDADSGSEPLRRATNPNPLSARLSSFKDAREKSISISFKDLGLKLGDGRQILQGVTGSFEAGKLYAVMGPSGSGKTTFLSVISGRLPRGTQCTGELFVNGKLENSIANYNKMVGFVPQDDTMLRELTVREVLKFSAELRLPSYTSSLEIDKIVEDVISLLGLSEIRYAQIGSVDKRGISGGQRKRVNIGMELVADPIILFLDEPTSGLDSSSSKEVCNVLKLLTSMGLTVVSVIHQPRYEIFQMFDEVLLLGKGGKTVYLGPTEEVSNYFEELGFVCPPHINPADFYLDVISGDVRPSKALPMLAEISLKSSDSIIPIKQGTRPNDGFNPQVLVEVWQQRAEEIRAAQEEEKPKKPIEGTKGDLIQSVLSGMLPLTLLVLIIFSSNNKKRVYGLLYGTMLISLMVCIAYMLVLESAVAIAFLTMLSCLIVAEFIYVSVKLSTSGKPEEMEFLLNFVSGFYFGPLMAIIEWLPFRTYQQNAAAELGFASCAFLILAFGFPYFAYERTYPTWLDLVVFIAGMCILAFIIVKTTRYHKLGVVHGERKSVGIFYQLVVFTARGSLQQLRNWKAIAFDLGIVFIAGTFLGLVFGGRPYKGPLLSPFGLEIGGKLKCPPLLMQLFSPLCQIAMYPLDDPIIGQASLSLLALCLSAVASSIRIFGDEQVEFKRESATGISTGAYYLGKSISHLATIFTAPAVFLFAFTSLAVVEGNYWEHYLLFVAAYFLSAGIAYTVSVLTPPNLAQLVGVLVLLASMMYSGASPTLNQLENNKIMPNVLQYPAHVSFLRWAQELYYLIEIKMYQFGEQSMRAIYSYNLDDFILCWLWMATLAIFFRLVAYIALVRR